VETQRIMEEYKVWMPFNTPSSKNGRRWTGKYFIASKQTMNYQKLTKDVFEREAVEFRAVYDSLKKPVEISFKYIRGSRHKFDYVNPLQTSQDEMVKAGWIDDDNADCIIPVFEQYEYNKENPGTWITITKNNEPLKPEADESRTSPKGTEESPQEG